MKKSKPQSEGIFILVVATLLFIANFSPALAGNIAGGAFNHWPDTGQTKCYNNFEEIPCPGPESWFYGQDAQYQGPQRSYTKLGYGGVELPDSATQDDGWIMTRDNVTGLIWEIKTDDGSIHDKDNRYTWCDQNIETNGGDQGLCGEGTDTEDFIAALNNEQFGGFSDWRLPTIKELSTIVYTGVWPAPLVDKAFFPNMVMFGMYLSATTNLESPASVWMESFYTGEVKSNWKGANGCIIAVRSVTPIHTSSFVDNHDGTITDTNTGLMWQKCSMGQVYNSDTNACEGPVSTYHWDQAFAEAENLELAGYSDWRLPNRNELQSIVDYSLSNPAINGTYFGMGTSLVYWTSSSSPAPGYQAYNIFFGNGLVSQSRKDYRYEYAIRAVRFSQIEVLGDSDYDSDVDGKDLSGLASALSTGNYDPAFDLNHDDQLNELDVEIFAENFGIN